MVRKLAYGFVVFTAMSAISAFAAALPAGEGIAAVFALWLLHSIIQKSHSDAGI